MLLTWCIVATAVFTTLTDPLWPRTAFFVPRHPTRANARVGSPLPTCMLKTAHPTHPRHKRPPTDGS